MGYQVGNHCYATKQEAENVYFSLVVPVIQTTQTATSGAVSGRYPPSIINQQNAKLLQPEYLNGRWTFNGQTVQANLPECSPVQNMKDGAELGWYVAGVLAAIYVIVIIKRLIR